MIQCQWLAQIRTWSNGVAGWDRLLGELLTDPDSRAPGPVWLQFCSGYEKLRDRTCEHYALQTNIFLHWSSKLWFTKYTRMNTEYGIAKQDNLVLQVPHPKLQSESDYPTASRPLDPPAIFQGIDVLAYAVHISIVYELL